MPSKPGYDNCAGAGVNIRIMERPFEKMDWETGVIKE